MQSIQMETKKGNKLEVVEHFHFQQRLVHLVNALLTVIQWGRGTGKSAGVVAPRIIHNAKAMPRSAGGFCAPSFRKFTDHEWPGIRKTLNGKFRLEEGRDYVFMRKPPDHWPVPYMAPEKYKYFVTFRNGAGFHVLSFDHDQTANALDMDWCIVDEAKLLDGKRVQEEVFNTLRGNRDYFGHRPEHLSRWLLSDKYTRANSKQTAWISAYAEKATNPKILIEIIEKALLLQECKNKRLRSEVERLLFPLQKGAVFFSEADTMANIHAVGEEFIMNAINSNTPAGALASIFNMDVKRGEGSLFYPLFNEGLHTYSNNHNNRIEETIWQHGYDKYREDSSCKYDKDLQRGKPLRVYVDPGGRYNWAIVAQKQGNIIRYLKNFWVEKPRKIKDLMEDIMDYYRLHDKKQIELYYGIDAKKENYTDERTVAQQVLEFIQRKKWDVEDKMENINTWVSHQKKYEFGMLVMDQREDRDDRFPQIMINRDNCKELIWSISKAELKPGENKYEKDKRSERNVNLPQWQATHLSDAFDWTAIDYLEELEGISSGYLVSMHG